MGIVGLFLFLIVGGLIIDQINYRSYLLRVEEFRKAERQRLKDEGLAEPSNIDVLYTHEDGLKYSYASQLAYCPGWTVRNWDCGLPCEKLPGYRPFYLYSEDFPKYSISFAILVNDASREILVTFEGTENFAQLVEEIWKSGGHVYEL